MRSAIDEMTDAPSQEQDAPAADEEAWWAQPGEAVAEKLDVDPEEGLSTDEAEQRRAEVGPNELREHETLSVWTILANQFKSLIIGLLVVEPVVLAVRARWGETSELR